MRSLKPFFALALLLSASQSIAQVQNFDMPIFRGNYAERGLALPVADSAKPVTARGYYAKFGRPLPDSLQPFTIRSARPGTSVVVRFEKTLSMPDVAWVEIYVSGQTRAAGRVLTTKNISPVVTTPPTTSSPGAPVTVDGTKLVPFIKIISLENAASGFPILHGQNTNLVRADFFWTDSSQRDPVWSVSIESDNTVRAVGPPNERFFGQVVLEFYKK